jgi:hypothetical protein
MQQIFKFMDSKGLSGNLRELLNLARHLKLVKKRTTDLRRVSHGYVFPRTL